MRSVNLSRVLLTGALFVSISSACDSNKCSNTLKGDLVSKDSIAVKIAEAVCIPLYGEDIISQKPYQVRSESDKWIVEGSRQKNEVGGTFHVEIEKKCGTILKVTHSK